MPYVADLVEDSFVRAQSEPSDYCVGLELADRGEVLFLQRLPVWITAVVSGERVQLHAAHAHLRWTCTCGGAEGGRMCRHVVALAREAGRRSPRKNMQAGDSDTSDAAT
jgi:uncharacterized Zn finger protein